MTEPGASARPFRITELAERAAALVPSDVRAILGIVGAPGSGKTTLAELLVAELRRTRPDGWVAHVPMDGYHLGDDQLRRLRSLHRKGAPDTFDADGYRHLLTRIMRHTDEWIYVPGFERTLEQPIAAALVVPPAARLVITEGNYLLLDDPAWRSAATQLTEAWFVSTEPALRRQRLIDRHIRFGKSADAAHDWVSTVDEPNAALIDQGRHRADTLVLNTPDGWCVVSASAVPDLPTTTPVR